VSSGQSQGRPSNSDIARDNVEIAKTEISIYISSGAEAESSPAAGQHRRVEAIGNGAIGNQLPETHAGAGRMKRCPMISVRPDYRLRAPV